MSDLISAVTDSDFDQQVLQSTKPVLVDFWAPWCQPCLMLAPLLEEIAAQYVDKIKVVKLNIDENNANATKYGIRSIPTLLLFKDGQVSATKIGGGSKSQLIAFLDSAL